MITNVGKYYLREFIAGADLSSWTSDRSIYMGAGTSSNTNAAVLGPSGTTYRDKDGAWQGPAPSDWKLSNEVTSTRPECTFSVGSNGTIHVQALFNDTNFISGTTEDYDLIEFGLFLSQSGAAGNSAVDFPTTANKSSGMICRNVNFYEEENQYKPYYYSKDAGKSLVVNIDVIDFAR